ncbi:hypothetical protein BSKO_02278 [Bryopsis sp. KO-2023]|nr:hypothetical protein BSKO_02278 [Bryopsis sp. KO-2023]
MSFKGLNGTKRIIAEYTYIYKLIEDGHSPHLSDLTLVGDNILTWQFKVKNFDEDIPGGAALNADLRKLNEKHQQDHLLLEATFPMDYPTEPFFLRVISPRCVWYTGHVTAGGSICIESLTHSGTPGSWNRDFSFEAIMNVVTTNMIDCESVQVVTRTGPGGRSGPLRIDHDHRYCSSVMSPYSMSEAKSAFQRTLRHHSQVGWGGEGNSSSTGPQQGRRSSSGTQRPTPSKGTGAIQVTQLSTSGALLISFGKAISGTVGKAISGTLGKRRGAPVNPPPSTSGEPQPMSSLPQTVPPAPVPSSAQGLAVNRGHQAPDDPKLKNPIAPGRGAAGSSGRSGSKKVPDWVKAKPKPLRKLYSENAAQPVATADNGIFDEVFLMLEKEGEKEKLEKSKKDDKKMRSGKAEKGEGSSAVETIDLLEDDLPIDLSTESEAAWKLGAPSSTFEQEKKKMKKMEEEFEQERRRRDAEMAEMERQVRLAKQKSKLVCDPPPNWFPQIDDRNLMVVELPFKSPQAAPKNRKGKSTPGGSDPLAETDADVSMISEMLRKEGYLQRTTKIFRVQNTKLWTKYNLWRNDIREDVGAGKLNEQHLWHGADIDTLGKIINEGFDARVSQLSGSMGGGIYFSEKMRYSEDYSRSAAHSVGASNVPKKKTNPGRKRKIEEMDFIMTTFSTSVNPVNQMPCPHPGELGMLLARVVLGKSYEGSALTMPGTRKAPDGYHSIRHRSGNAPIHAIYDNPQAYPEFLIFFR